jgi:hypothetical protein
LFLSEPSWFLSEPSWFLLSLSLLALDFDNETREKPITLCVSSFCSNKNQDGSNKDQDGSDKNQDDSDKNQDDSDKNKDTVNSHDYHKEMSVGFALFLFCCAWLM